MATHPDRIRLEIPAQPEYVVLARLTVSGVAGRAGFSYDDVEDLKVVTTEACRLLIGDGTDGSISITYRFEGAELEIVGEVEADTEVEADELALHMIAALSDTHDLDTRNGYRRVRAVKRRAG